MYPFTRVILTAFLSFSLLSTLYLYTYPVFHGCAFPTRHSHTTAALWTWLKQVTGSDPSAHIDVPFRLLALGDPQLEGDSSLLDLDDGYFPSLQTLLADLLSSRSVPDLLAVIAYCIRDLFTTDIPRIIQFYRKRLDIFGNDLYLAHIYHTVHWFTKPTHVTVLGDLLGSQWVSDEEFERRGRRYWKRVFRHGQRVDDEIAIGNHLGALGQDKSWETRIINIAGNHDVGYAGDMTAERIQRFERVFGKANWETRFILGRAIDDDVFSDSVNLPELRIAVLNSLNLDTPALSQEHQANTYSFINDVIGTSRPVEDRTTLTLVLTHLPLHKEAGVCTDGPHFAFYSENQGGGLKEQNHQSYSAGKGILEGIFGMSDNPYGPGRGMGRNGIILTGHDHEGCDIRHYLLDTEFEESRTWKTKKWDRLDSHPNQTFPSIREITVRSMMGEFGGNAGLLSAWFDYDIGEWRTEYSTCSLGTQHIWWTIHVIDLLAAVLFLVFGTFQLRSLSAHSLNVMSRGSAANSAADGAEELQTTDGSNVTKSPCDEDFSPLRRRRR